MTEDMFLHGVEKLVPELGRPRSRHAIFSRPLLYSAMISSRRKPS